MWATHSAPPSHFMLATGLNGFESHYKLMQEKLLAYAFSGVASNITHSPIG